MGSLFLDGHKLHYHLDLVERWLRGDDVAPIHAEMSPASACNQRCKFCYRDFDGHKPDKLTEAVFLSAIRSMAKAGIRSILLAGDGEPLINKATPEAIILGGESGIDMALNSNGALLDEKTSERILKHLTWIRFSVMSSDPKIYSYIHGVKNDLPIVVKNIKKCVEIKKRDNLKSTIGIQQVLLNENAETVYDTAKLARDAGVDYYVLKPFSKHPMNDFKADTDLHLKHSDILKKAETLSSDNFKVIIRWNTFSDEGDREYDRCLGLPFIAQIGADGGFYSCCPFFGDNRFLYGNLYEKSFEEILASEKRAQIIRRISNDLDVHKECMSYCRHHQINKFLWMLKHPPAHVNFI